MDPLQKIKKIKEVKPKLPTGPILMNKNKKGVQFMFKFNLWKILIAFLIFLFFFPFLISFFQLNGNNGKVTTSQAMVDIKDGKVDEVLIQGKKLIVNYKDKSTKVTTIEADESFAGLLDKYKIDPTTLKYSVVDQSLTKVLGDMLGILLPVGLMAALFFFVIRSQTKGAQDIFSFGRSKAKIFAKGKQSTTFADVAGVDDAKKELE